VVVIGFANIQPSPNPHHTMIAADKERGMTSPSPNQMRFNEIHRTTSMFDPSAEIREGAIIRVTAGPLMGYEGPVVQRLKSGQIRIYLHVFGEYRDVEIAPSVLELVA
jgi:transcription antitermination factor NusG